MTTQQLTQIRDGIYAEAKFDTINDFALLCMEKVSSRYEAAIYELRSKMLHLEDRGNDFEIMGAFIELDDKIKAL